MSAIWLRVKQVRVCKKHKVTTPCARIDAIFRDFDRYLSEIITCFVLCARENLPFKLQSYPFLFFSRDFLKNVNNILTLKIILSYKTNVNCYYKNWYE